MIYPGEILENTSEANFSRHSTRSKVIYMVILSCFTGCILLLPWIHVEVGVRSQGMIRPDVERTQVHSPVSGVIEHLMIRENRTVKQGQVMAVINSGVIREKIEYSQERTNLVSKYISDLKTLSALDTLKISDPRHPEQPDTTLPDMSPLTSAHKQPVLLTDRYRRSLHEYRIQMTRAYQELEKAGRGLNRNSYLSERELISEIELEESEFSYNSAKHQYQLIMKQQMHQWTLDKFEFLNEQNQLKLELEDLNKALEEYKIKAPLSGSIQNLSGIQTGSFVNQHQVITEISPDTELIAELYVSPADIGLLSSDMPVRVQIDAFDHNQWGIVSGSVIEISGDVDQIENQPVFRVQCKLNRDYLTLSNGYRGDLKKGMTLQARFVIAKRSLFQLLHDKLDNWFNPLWS